MVSAFFSVLALAASAAAYQVTSPSSSQGWTTAGPNVLSWSRVNTDRLNFTAVLSNQVDQGVLPSGQEVLVALVNGTDNSITVSPPSAGWPVGYGFRVNLVQDAQNLNTLLAQSDQFNITENGTPTSTSSSASSTGSSTASASSGSKSSASATSTGSSSGSSSDALNPSSSAPDSAPTHTNAAMPSLGMQSGFIGVLALLGAFLA